MRSDTFIIYTDHPKYIEPQGKLDRLHRDTLRLDIPVILDRGQGSMFATKCATLSIKMWRDGHDFLSCRVYVDGVLITTPQASVSAALDKLEEHLMRHDLPAGSRLRHMDYGARFDLGKIKNEDMDWASIAPKGSHLRLVHSR